MGARNYFIEEIQKYNPSLTKQEIEKVLAKYKNAEIERLVDAMIRFGTDNIFKVILKRR